MKRTVSQVFGPTVSKGVDFVLFLLEISFAELLWWSSGQDQMLPTQGLGLISGQGTRSHMLQLRIHVPQLKILCA